MKINKIVRGTRVIADNVRVCETIASRIRGLMFRKKLRNNDALVIINEHGSISNARLHMLFVFQKIDIIWLDKQLEIVDLRQDVMPFTPLLTPSKPAKYIIELLAGKIRESELEIGDKLKFL